ncbi:MAG: HAD-IC family P-type ATPase, partial [Arcobacteraceae bacterium]
MHKELKIIHQTPFRVRFYWSVLKEEINLNKLQHELDSLQNNLKVRINAKACSVIFESDTLDTLYLKKSLKNISFESYKMCENLTTNSCHFQTDKKPSLNAFIKASTALSVEPFIQNPTAKFLVTSLATHSLLINGTKELFSKGLTSTVLEAMAVAVSLARKDYLAANSTNTMLELGEYIEETTVHKSDDLIKELAKPNIEKVWIERFVDELYVEEQINTSELKIGDIVVVGAGDTIAIDGHIISGTASINQVSMTGESAPVKRQRGDRVISGTVIEEGRIKIWAEQIGEETATARIRNYIATSLNEKSSVGLKATKLADKLVPVTLGLAGFSYLINRNFESVAAVLQADYSCALKLATPVAFKSSISKAGKSGIMIKGAKSIEAIQLADTFVFDKTGTLTYGQLEVESITSFDKNWSEELILNLTASAEEHYFHPVAQAVVKAAKEKGFVHMHHEEVDFIVAHGVKTVVQGKEVVIGSRHFLEDDEEIDFSAYKREFEESLKSGKTILYVGYDKKLLGMISMN